jgi:hypothetical protein
VKGWWRVLGVAGVLASIAPGCGGQSSGGGTDTNTNWLKQCVADADCGGLSCLCNVCTAPCESDAVCTARGAAALCSVEQSACSQGARICVADTTTGAAGSEATDEGRSGDATASAEEELGICGHPASDYFGDFRCEETGVVCLPPSESFVDRCGCGCTSVDAYPRTCRSQCPFDFDCGEVRIDRQDGFATVEQTWTALCPILAVLEGSCGDGKVFLFYSNGYTGQVRYYDAARQRTLGIGAFTDDLDRNCGGQRYWPEPVLCDMPTVTRVICGSIDVGYVFPDLPWADGRPGDLP